MTTTLQSLKANVGARRRKTRKGRGIAAGQGASCGFGMRGQKSRSGRPTRPRFEAPTPLSECPTKVRTKGVLRRGAYKPGRTSQNP
jgi:ribosomal protein L15